MINLSPRSKPGWLHEVDTHQVMLDVQKPKFILMGDSIAKGLGRYPSVWRLFNSTLNLGIGGDRVEHVMWRLKKHVFPDSVRAVILLCGTNNINKDLQYYIADFIVSCLNSFKFNFKLVVASVLPREKYDGVYSQSAQLENRELSLKCENYLDTDHGWDGENRILNHDLFYKYYLHLSVKGCLMLSDQL